MLKSIKNSINQLRVRNRQKIFCVGRNKTGTTSLKKAFQQLNMLIGDQREAERLLPDYRKNEFDRIIKYCRTSQVFQDFPFSYPKTYKFVDEAFPGSKFILTIRDSPEQWYNSITKFHGKLFGKGTIPSKNDLQDAPYVWKGWMWECNRLIYNTPEEDPYNKEILIKSYTDHNNSVIDYFKTRPKDLIVINLSDSGSYKELMHFLDIDSHFKDFPWENRTEDIKIRR